jgi:hypothetical protein
MASVYATAAEFLRHPTGLDTDDLLPFGSPTDEASELALIMQMASSLAEQITLQPLYARQASVTRRVVVDADGTWTVPTRDFPVLAAVPSASQWQFPGLTNGWGSLEGQTFLVERKQITLTAPARGGWVNLAYIVGYPNAVLTAPVTSGALTLPLDTTVGVNEGDSMTIYDGDSQEGVTVAAVVGQNVTLAAPTLYAHAAGVRVSELPLAVTLATIYIAAWIIKGRRGGATFSMDGAAQMPGEDPSGDLGMARLQLRPFMTVI